jgi:N-methylhydantoinase B
MSDDAAQVPNDLVTTEIIRNYLETVSQELSATVENTALSPIFTLNHDYSCGVFHYDGAEASLLARDQAVPVHIFACLDSVQIMFDYFANDIHEADVFLVTDPYMGGTHCPDWTIIKPVFVDGSPRLFPCVRGHVNDVGGPVPGNYNVNARDVWQEGFRISPIRLLNKGIPVRELWEVVLANTRLPDEVRGDLWAMVGACQVGQRRIEELVTKYGSATLEKSVDYIKQYSETQLRRLIKSWPDGSYSHTEYIDHDYAGHYDIPVPVTVNVEDDQVTVDLTKVGEQVAGFINSPRGNTLSQVFTAVTALAPDIPVNSGFFRPIRVLLSKGSVVDPRPPAPVGHCTLMPGSTIIDSVMKAFEQIVPKLVGTAACDLNQCRAFGVDSRTGKYWINSDMNATPMSAGGGRGTDGWGAWAATFCALKLPPIEMNELQYPYLYIEAEYAPDTAAPGQWRGAPAFQYRRRNTDMMHGSVYCGGKRNPLAGYVGGRRGAGNYYVLREGSADEMLVTDKCYSETLPKGSVLFGQSGGGGGWGEPLERDPETVLEDWLNELVSLSGAERDYGVAIDAGAKSVDWIATGRLRDSGPRESLG